MSANAQVDTLIHAGWIVTVNAERQILTEHSLGITDDRISHLLPTATARQQLSADQILELPEHVLMPGLINMHGHAAMSLFRGMGDDLPLITWLQDHIWPAEGRFVSPEFVRDGTELAIAEMLRCGTTYYADNYFFPEDTIDIIRQSGIRSQICFPILDFPTNWGDGPDTFLHKGLALAAQLKGDRQIMVSLGPHAPYTVSDEPFRKIIAASEQHDLLIQMHVHETATEVSDSERDRGQRPLVRLRDLGLLSPRMQCVHMAVLNDDDIRIVADSGATVVHCPESNLKLASGFCRVHDLQQAGVNLTLGTDGAASNNDLDMFGELRTAAQLAKAVSGNAEALPAHAALEMATINAAHALRLADRLGSLEIGKQADLIAVDFSGLESQPLYDPVSHLVYATSRDQVQHVWVAGRQLVRNRALTTLDTDAIRARARHWQQRIIDGQQEAAGQ
ncbi:TRZ/ATZ family hydrolase [Natronospirillum operosum]|uniref:TRZ/ATZ family hydrolase n=1 Tax=Natronospirillum operosum TaxID=2759953 RepID=A0A4Z0WAY1_9GAMM|nr:TRZ/ATZ family hydrolase [Natronospirillum operosum]TGG95809.1 TRZ/ATZ family hydrolase [Natronospirillum operosum]